MAVKSKRGPKHKTRMDREATLSEVARLERMRYTQREIAARLGLSQPQICFYQKELKARYAATQFDNTAELVAEKVAQLDDLVNLSREAFDRSTKGVEKVKDADGNETLEETIKAGDAAFLARIESAIKAQRELLGLDAPTKQDVRAAVVGVNVARAEGLPRAESGVVDWSALSGRPPVTDPVDDAEVTPALPPHVNGTNGRAK